MMDPQMGSLFGTSTSWEMVFLSWDGGSNTLGCYSCHDLVVCFIDSLFGGCS